MVKVETLNTEEVSDTTMLMKVQKPTTKVKHLLK